MSTLPTTYLFVPGDRPERFEKALAASAGAVILDLEDAVAPAAKAAARRSIAAWWSSRSDNGPPVLLRINDAASDELASDLALLAELRPSGALLPKTEHAEQIDKVRGALPEGFVVPLIETARGIANLERIAAASGVQRLAFGTLDYAVDLDLSGDERGLIYASSRIAIVSRATGLASPVAGVTAEINDEAKLAADLAFARAFGFGAKLCIHPRQVAAVHRLLMPASAEIEWAERVIAASATGAGAVQVDGKMVDAPVVARARTLLARAGR